MRGSLVQNPNFAFGVREGMSGMQITTLLSGWGAGAKSAQGIKASSGAGQLLLSTCERTPGNEAGQPSVGTIASGSSCA